jgi:hypothetical protein
MLISVSGLGAGFAMPQQQNRAVAPRIILLVIGAPAVDRRWRFWSEGIDQARPDHGPIARY